VSNREKPTVQTALWAGALAIVDGLPRETGNTRRHVGEFTVREFPQDGNGTTVRTTYEVEQPDGASKVYTLTLTVEESRDDKDEWWGPGSRVDQADPSKRVVIGSEHYLIGDGTDGCPEDGFLGFGGRRFEIEFFDGRKVTTRDLWHQGVIPPKWRERYPDNARFVQPEGDSPQGGESRG
jgi:hypothetical protein